MSQTIIRFFEESVAKFPNNTYLCEKNNGAYKGTTYLQVQKEVYRFAAGLLALGIQRGDRLALISEGRNDWVISELGILYTGAINVPMSVKLTETSEIRYRMGHSEARMAIVSARQVEKVKRAWPELPLLEKLILLDGGADETANEINFETVKELGDKYLETSETVFRETWNSVKPDDPANICYTSGTTADPKGIILSHNNYVANVTQSYTLMDIPSHYTTLLILPWDHAFAHTCGIYCMMGMGASLASVYSGKSGLDSLKNIPVNIKEIRPHLLLSVPTLAANFRKNIERNIREKGKLINTLFNHALRLSYSYNGIGYDKGKGLTFLYKPLIWLYDQIIFSKVREGFGGRLEFFVGGGALLDIELQRFFYAIGIPMFQGYGLTESSPVISSNSKKRHKLGSSGVLVKDMELKICDDKGNSLPVGEKGEIVIKGENVMTGYWKNEKATADTIRDGWLHTGDLGYMDKDGFLYVLGRFKSLLISDDGEKYSPEGMEETFVAQSKFIHQCMLHNNQNPYTICLIVPNCEMLKAYLKHKNTSPASEEGIKLALNKIYRELQLYRAKGHYENMFPQRWLPAATGILSEAFTEDNHMMNSTMKMVRGKITAHYDDLIRFMYTPEGKDLYNPRNVEAMKKLLNS
ncbi:MAG TPA: AMP-binding protein [Bacteroidales bacterium]|nr:AMP-binding protein [Bacteroidales bacterium]